MDEVTKPSGRGPWLVVGALVALLAFSGFGLFAGDERSTPEANAVKVANTSASDAPKPDAAKAQPKSASESDTARGSAAGNEAAQNALKVSDFGRLSETDKKAFGALVRQYLLDNPQVLIEVQRALEIKMELEQAERMKVALEKNRDAMRDPKRNLVIGNPDGDVTVVEFFDYNCGFCRRAVDVLANLVGADKNVRLILQEMPIFGRESEEAARLAIAARKQGKYWEMHSGLLKAKGRANEATGLIVAKQLGLDVDKLKKDAASEETTQFIRNAQKLGRELGIQGTPHFFVNDQMIAGAPENLEAQLRGMIAAERKKAKKS